MSVEATFTLACETSPLGDLAAADLDLSFEMERVVPAGERVMPYLWVYGTAQDAFERTASDTPGVETVLPLDRFEDSALYRIEWDRDTEQFITGIVDTGGVVVEAHGRTEWQFRIRFECTDDLAAFREHCRDHGIDYRLQRIQTVTTEEAPEFEFGLTWAQHEAVLAAVEQGYFEVPRAVLLSDLAAELDISQQAVSEHLRRGVNKILHEVIG